MSFPNIPLHICVNEGTQIAIVEVFRCEVSPYTERHNNPLRVFIPSDGGVPSDTLPEYRREAMESEYREIEEIANRYNVYSVECADYVPTIYRDGKKWSTHRFI